MKKEFNMKKFLKSLLLVAFSAVMAVSALCISACGGNSTVEGSAGLSYVLNDAGDGYIFSNLGTCTDKNVVIGNTYNGKPVVGIGEGACRDDKDAGDFKVVVESITVSNGITEMAFRGLQNWNVKKIILGDEVPSLGMAAFRLNKNLEVIVIGKGMTTIGRDAFSKLEENAKTVTIYYKGSEADWGKITIDESNNTFLQSAKCKIVYNYRGDGSEL